MIARLSSRKRIPSLFQHVASADGQLEEKRRGVVVVMGTSRCPFPGNNRAGIGEHKGRYVVLNGPSC
jgi:hypothetical protein